MAQEYSIIHSPGKQNFITLNDRPFCTVFDDRWKTGRLDPRTWQIRLNQDTFTMIQLEFLAKSSDVVCLLHDTSQTELKRHGMVKKRYGFEWNDKVYSWHQSAKKAWTLTVDGNESGYVIAKRSDTGLKQGTLSTITIQNKSGLPSYPNHMNTSTTTTTTTDEKSPVRDVGDGRVLVPDEVGLPDILILGTALCIESASIDGGVLSSRPPTGTRAFGFATGGCTVVNTG